MTRTIQVLLLLLLTLGGIGAHEALPEGCRLIRGQQTPDLHEDDVSVCVSRNWIHRDLVPVGNEVSGATQPPSFDATEPTTSREEGAGGTTVALAGPGALAAPTSYVVVGEITGNIDTIASQFYVTAPVDEQLAEIWASFDLVIDGQVVYSSPQADEVPVWATGQDLIVTGGFVITNVFDALGGVDDPDAVHTIELRITPDSALDTGAFHFDAIETSAHVHANLPSEVGYQRLPNPAEA